MAAGEIGICSRCMTIARTERYTKSWMVPAVIGGLFLVVAVIGIPLLIYAFVAGHGQRCPRCRTEGPLLPANTPAGKALYTQVKNSGNIVVHQNAHDYARALEAETQRPRKLVRNQFGGTEWVEDDATNGKQQRLVDGEWVDVE